MDPNFVWENRKFTVVELEDEIPFWVVRGDRKKVVSKKAHQALRVPVNTNSRLRKQGKRSQKKPAATILQAMERSGADRLRITLVDRSAIHHYFDEDKEPRGEVLPNALVFLSSRQIEQCQPGHAVQMAKGREVLLSRNFDRAESR